MSDGHSRIKSKAGLEGAGLCCTWFSGSTPDKGIGTSIRQSAGSCRRPKNNESRYALRTVCTVIGDTPNFFACRDDRD